MGEALWSKVNSGVGAALSQDYVATCSSTLENINKKIVCYFPSLIFIKMAIILPTGQWYAPSAVINDALIMPEYARACQSMPEYARVCQSMPEYARVCKSMPEYAIRGPDGAKNHVKL